MISGICITVKSVWYTSCDSTLIRVLGVNIALIKCLNNFAAVCYAAI